MEIPRRYEVSCQSLAQYKFPSPVYPSRQVHQLLYMRASWLYSPKPRGHWYPRWIADVGRRLFLHGLRVGLSSRHFHILLIGHQDHSNRAFKGRHPRWQSTPNPQTKTESATIMSKAESKSSQQTAESSASAGDDWSSVQDPNERRRIQNRIAQRKFSMQASFPCIGLDRSSLLPGDKARQHKEDIDRSEENKRRAGGSYTAAEPKDLDRGEEEGLPWGSLSLKHVSTTGRTKEQSSKDTSAYNAASRAGGSSR